MDDETLVRMFWDRDERAIDRVREQYEPYCRYIAQNVLHDRLDTEECLNDALLAAWNSIPPQKPQNLKTYLGKLIREIAVDRWRKNHAQKRAVPAPLVPLDELENLIGENSLDEAVSEEELAREISSFLRSLSVTERLLFVRRYWYYDSIRAIQDRTGFGKSKIAVTLKRTRDKLAAHLKKAGYMI